MKRKKHKINIKMKRKMNRKKDKTEK